MRHFRGIAKLLALVPALALVACGSDSDSGPEPHLAQSAVLQSPLGEEYLVGYGETIRVDALTMEFTAVADDGRCPFEAACLPGPGNARILVTVWLRGMVGALELNTNPELPVRAIFEGYLIELRALAPEIPRRLGPPEQYEATLFVARAPS